MRTNVGLQVAGGKMPTIATSAVETASGVASTPGREPFPIVGITPPGGHGFIPINLMERLFQGQEIPGLLRKYPGIRGELARYGSYMSTLRTPNSLPRTVGSPMGMGALDLSSLGLGAGGTLALIVGGVLLIWFVGTKSTARKKREALRGARAQYQSEVRRIKGEYGARGFRKLGVAEA